MAMYDVLIEALQIAKAAALGTGSRVTALDTLNAARAAWESTQAQLSLPVHGTARQVPAPLVMVRHGQAWPGTARLHSPIQGRSRHDSARRGNAGHGRAGLPFASLTSLPVPTEPPRSSAITPLTALAAPAVPSNHNGPARKPVRPSASGATGGSL